MIVKKPISQNYFGIMARGRSYRSWNATTLQHQYSCYVNGEAGNFGFRIGGAYELSK